MYFPRCCRKFFVRVSFLFSIGLTGMLYGQELAKAPQAHVFSLTPTPGYFTEPGVAVNPANSAVIYVGTDAGVGMSTDGGASWNAADLGKDHAKYAWRLWSYHWKPARSGECVILSRASDSQGRVQPDAAVWNPSGYLYNAYDQVKVYVQA